MIILACDERTDADRALGAGPIFHDDGLAPFLAKRVGENPCRGIVGASGRKRHDQLDLSLGPIGTRRQGRQSHDQGRKDRQRAQPPRFAATGPCGSRAISGPG
jgi:hypothetical protein